MERDISPPPIKRRKVDKAPPPRTQEDNHTCLLVFSWNINGINAFLPPSPSSHRITSFFQPTTPRSGTPTTTNNRPATHTSLRAFLARHSFPQVLFLQELKIAPHSSGEMRNALLSELNTPLHAGDEISAERRYTLHMCLPRDRYNVRAFGGRLYGVGIMIRADFAGEYVKCVRGVEWDSEGRVGVVELFSSVQSRSRSRIHVRPESLVYVQPGSDSESESHLYANDNKDNYDCNDNSNGSSSKKRPHGCLPPYPCSDTRSEDNIVDSKHSYAQDDYSSSSDNKNVGPKHKPLALLNIYAPNGTTALYFSPTTGKPTGTRHEFKREFHSRLRDECIRLEKRGFHVVLAGDVNVARERVDGFPWLREVPVVHCVNRADFNYKFFCGGDRGIGAVGIGEGGYKGRGHDYDGHEGLTGEEGVGEENGGRGGDGERGGCGDMNGQVVDDGTGGRGGNRKGDNEGGRDGKQARKRGQNDTGKTSFDGIDIFREMHRNQRRYTYYPRGREWGSSCDRVDMVIVSRGLWNTGRVVATGILDTPQERGPSDHVPIWASIDMKE